MPSLLHPSYDVRQQKPCFATWPTVIYAILREKKLNYNSFIQSEYRIDQFFQRNIKFCHETFSTDHMAFENNQKNPIYEHPTCEYNVCVQEDMWFTSLY